MPYLNGQEISDDDLQGKLKEYRAQNAGAPADDQSIINFWQTGQKNWGDGVVSQQSAPATAPGPASQWVSQQVQTANPQNTARDSELYNAFKERALQPATVDANNPVVKAQTDAYAAEQTRASRNSLADLAEKAGPYANLRGEQRLASERTGQAIGGFQAEMLGRELQNIRNEKMQALESMRGMLSQDEQLQLQREIADLDAELRRQGYGLQNRSLDLQQQGQENQRDAFLRELALRQYQTDLGSIYGF